MTTTLHAEIEEKTIAFVKQKLEDAEGGHDWWHIERVYNKAIHIANSEPKADLLVVKLAALLHDIADSKFHNGDEEIGPKTAADFLTKMNVDSEVVVHVIDIIRSVSFKGGYNTRTIDSIELNIVQDADRLDAIGAIGIARTFNYGGHKGNEIYNPGIEPNMNMSKEEYKAGGMPSINHFYEKLLLLKDMMNTKMGYELATKRHEFMELYLEQFYDEWKGDK